MLRQPFVLPEAVVHMDAKDRFAQAGCVRAGTDREGLGDGLKGGGGRKKEALGQSLFLL